MLIYYFIIRKETVVSLHFLFNEQSRKRGGSVSKRGISNEQSVYWLQETETKQPFRSVSVQAEF
jgi:hypothetical protein